MNRHDFRFFDRLRVRWAEIDAQRIVFNGHYLMYFDTAIAGYWRAMAMPYARTMRQLEGDLYVRKATVDYLASAVYDDLLDVGMRCERIGTSSMGFVGAAFRGEQMLVSCELVYVFADPATQTSRPVPPSLRAVLEGFEAGEPMLRVATGSWGELGEAARALRTAVFVEEQRIPAELEWDDANASALHAVAFNRFDMPLATGRLMRHAPGVGRIGRMAVDREARGGRVGQQVLDALTAAARERGDLEVVLHAQRTAVPFYLRNGFTPRGPEFDDAGIPHLEMTKAP